MSTLFKEENEKKTIIVDGQTIHYDQHGKPYVCVDATEQVDNDGNVVTIIQHNYKLAEKYVTPKLQVLKEKLELNFGCIYQTQRTIHDPEGTKLYALIYQPSEGYLMWDYSSMPRVKEQILTLADTIGRWVKGEFGDPSIFSIKDGTMMLNEKAQKGSADAQAIRKYVTEE